MTKTPLKFMILNLLKEFGKPVTVADLRDALKPLGYVPNKTTLYRQLEKMVDHQLVNAVVLDSKIAHYELKKHPHPHFICLACQQASCVEDAALEYQIETFGHQLISKGVRITSHQLSLFGYCKPCSINLQQ